jgi:membrane associated rhomboid family serine protease
MGNMLLMLVVGPPLEEKYGGKSLFKAILITAFASGVIQWAIFPGQALLGASGIVFMMIVMSSLAGMRNDSIPLTLIFVAVFYLGREVLDGVLKKDNISQITHVIGGVCGAVIGYALSGKKKRQAKSM